MEEYPNGISLESVFDAYYLCRRHKRRTANATVFEVNYESNLILLWKDINEYKYVIGKSIRFCVTRPKLREVFAADFRDRVVHHIIMMRLEPLFESVFITDNYNCRKDKGTLYGVKRLYQKIYDVSEGYTKDCWIGKFDIKGFFMSISRSLLWQKVESFIHIYYKGEDIQLLLHLSKQVIMHAPEHNCIIKGCANLLALLPANKSLTTCGDDFGLPIGNLTSQIFANFFLHEFDKEMTKRFSSYGRYVDDFYVVCTNKFDVLKSHAFAKEYLKQHLGIVLSDDKVYVLPYYHGVMFTGTMIKKDRMYISNRTLHNVSEKIEYFNHRLDDASVDSFICVYNSYMGFLNHTRAFNIRLELIKKITELMWKKVKLKRYGKVMARL